jgi:hypothetical protein
MLQYLFIKTQCIGEQYGTLYAVCRAHDMEGAN